MDNFSNRAGMAAGDKNRSRGAHLGRNLKDFNCREREDAMNFSAFIGVHLR
jgi:hypothetical protein